MATITIATSQDAELVIGYSTTALHKAGQSFVGNGEDLVSVSFYYYKTGTPASDIKISLQADSSGNPSGTDLATGTLDRTLVTSTTLGGATQITVTMSSYTLTNGTTYWLVWERSDGSTNTTNWIAVTRYAASSQYANGTSKQYLSGAWSTSSALHDLRGHITTAAAVTNTNLGANDFGGF